MGCYSSELINQGDVTVLAYHLDSIEAVVKRDGTRIAFPTPPPIVNNAFVNGDEQLFPEDIRYVVTKDGTNHLCNPPLTIYADLILIETACDARENICSHAEKIDFLVTTDGRKYTFEDSPRIVRDTIFGEVKAQGIAGSADDPGTLVTVPEGTQAAIPLADVRTVSVTEFDVGTTVVAIVLPLVVVGGIVAAVAVELGNMHYNFQFSTY
jgi:hypothetical protein